MKKLDRILHTIDSISEWSGRGVSFLILLVAFTVLYEVTARFVFNTPTLWSWDMSLFLYGAFAILGGAYTLLHEGHVKVDILHSRLSPRTRAIVDTATFILVFFFLGVLVWKGWQFASVAIQLGERTDSAWHPLVWPIRLMIPIGSFMMLAQGFAKFIRDLRIAFGRGES